MEQTFQEFCGEDKKTEVVKAEIPTEIKKSVQDQLPQTQPVKQETRVAPKPIQANDQGLLVGGSFEEQYRLATAYCRSGLVPAALNSPEKVLVAMQFSRELGLQPITAMRQICVINGVPSLWGDLPLSLVMQTGQLDDFGEMIYDVDYNEICLENKNLDVAPFTARCFAQRGKIRVERSFTMNDARMAGLIDKNRSIWKLYPRRMLQARARSWVLKDLFPDVLSGAAIAEYDFDVLPDQQAPQGQIETTPAGKLKERFGSNDS